MQIESESIEQTPPTQLNKTEATGEVDTELNRNVFPNRQQTRELYQLELDAQETPPIRLAQPGEAADLWLPIAENQTLEAKLADQASIRDEYEQRNIDQALSHSWWTRLTEDLKQHGLDPEQADTLQITAKHTADIVVDGEQQVDQSFEVFEVGETPAEKGSLETTFNTLRLLDQFSGGLLAANPNRPKILLGNDTRLAKNNSGVEVAGTADAEYIFINTSSIAEKAAQVGADEHEVLAAVIIHEMLGHGLERLVEGEAGTYFKKHFNYSKQHVEGKFFDSIHESITPKDDSKYGSEPVREYGRVNAAEDLATSVETTVGEALGLNNSTNKIETTKGNTDSYRTELVMGLMDTAAQQALKYRNTPGIVGSELRYLHDDEGNLTGVEPARKFDIKTVSGEVAIREEVEKIIDKYRFPDELVIEPSYGTIL
jgi:hypothetical protein